MLERMGWAEGRGLGSKEDGRNEHVRVAKKSDTLGELAGVSGWIVLPGVTGYMPWPVDGWTRGRGGGGSASCNTSTTRPTMDR